MVTGATAAAALVLGVIGFGEYDPRNGSIPSSQPFVDRLYETVSLFSFNQNLTPPLPAALEIARWLAPLAVAYAGFRVLAAIFAEQWVWFRVRIMFRRHVIVLGLGSCGMRLATSFRQRGDRVVAVDLNPAGAAVAGCAEEGIPLLRGDATDPAVLARVGFRNARLIFVVCGDDGTNADVAILITHQSRRRSAVHRVLVQISDARLCHLLEQSALTSPDPTGVRLEFFNLSRLGPRALLDAWLSPTVAGGRPPAIIVAGSGPLALSVVTETARQWRLGHRTSPDRIRVTLVAVDAVDQVAALQQRFPALARSADVAAVTADPADAMAPPLVLTPAAAVDGSQNAFRPDVAFACFEADAENVQAAIRLRRSLPDAVPIVACASGLAGTSLIAMLDRPASGYLANVHGFGLLDRICRPEIILNLDREILARAAHRDYVRRRLAQGADLANDPALSAWDDLPDSLQESNRAQVADIPAKLSAVGYELAPTEDWDTDLFVFPPEQIEALACMEHERFVEERVRAGYRLGPKDTAAKLSPYLVPWDQLSEDIRDLDRDAVRLVPSLLAAAGYAIVSPRRESRPPTTERMSSRPS